MMMKTFETETDPRLIIALDFAKREEALRLVDKLDPAKCRVKIGKEMFTRFGPDIVRDMQARNFEVFLDLKFHDIPATVAKACRAAVDLGVWMVNVHAMGGDKMLAAAREAVPRESGTYLIAVTVLTSMDAGQLQSLGWPFTPEQLVNRLAKLTHSAGLDGVVCSAQEASVIRDAIGAGFKLVTPGIRPAGSDLDDQSRVMTPSRALQAGADYLVVGRPITQAPSPADTLESILREIKQLV